MDRGESHVSGSRLSVRLTARGWQAVVIGVSIIIVARLIGTTQLHQLGYAMLALPVASLVLVLVFSGGLRYRRRVPSGVGVEAGRSVAVEISASNRSRFGTPHVDGQDEVPGTVHFEFDPIPSGGRGYVSTDVTFPKRGRYALGPASLSVSDPFDLVSLTRTFPEKTTVTVYPRVYELPGFVLHGRNSDSGGRGHTGQRGEEFAGLREYRRGDDRRSIHWKSLARTGELYVRENALHAPKRHTVALDMRRSGLRSQGRPVEDAVSASASVLAHLNASGLPMRLLHNGSVEMEEQERRNPDFGSGDPALRRCMETLATVMTKIGPTIAQTLADEGGRLGEGVVIVTPGTDEDLVDAVSRTVREGTSVTVIMVASHTYGASHGASGSSQAGGDFPAFSASLERAGANLMYVEGGAGVGGMRA